MPKTPPLYAFTCSDPTCRRPVSGWYPLPLGGGPRCRNCDAPMQRFMMPITSTIAKENA